MNPTSKKFISLFLAFSLMMLSVNLYAKEKRGAKLIITKKDGQLIKGELIAVKPNALLLLDTEGKVVSIDIADFKVIRIVKKSKVWTGAGIGLAISVGGGALIGALAGEGPAEDMSGLLVGLLVGAFFSPAVALLGAIIGAAVGTDKTIHFEGMTDLETEEALEKLCKKACIRDYK